MVTARPDTVPPDQHSGLGPPRQTYLSYNLVQLTEYIAVNKYQKGIQKLILKVEHQLV